MADGITLRAARRLTDAEKASYKPEYQDRMLIGAGEHIALPHVTWRDMLERPCEGEFPGCSNQAWVITQEEWDAFLQLDASRSAGAEEQAEADEVAELEAQKSRAEAQQDLPTAEEVARRIQEWINTQNEGAEGYVPHVYTRDEYDKICHRLAELKGDK